MIKELLGALAVPVVELEGWEGDDILGTLARRGEEQGCDMYLVTGDRDMYQLVTEHVHVVSTRKGLSDIAVMTPESVDDLYHGITPALVPDFYGLKGDSSDNIPGVPGHRPQEGERAHRPVRQPRRGHRACRRGQGQDGREPARPASRTRSSPARSRPS